MCEFVAEESLNIIWLSEEQRLSAEAYIGKFNQIRIADNTMTSLNGVTLIFILSSLTFAI